MRFISRPCLNISTIMILTASLFVNCLGAEANAVEAEPIKGGWFNLRNYSSQSDYVVRMKKAADAGMKYIIIQIVTNWSGSAVLYYSDIFTRLPGLQMDQLEALLSASDQYNLKVFVGHGFFNSSESWSLDKNLKAMEEIAAKYSHHPSFYGWYWSAECAISETEGFNSSYISNSKTASDKARQLTPNAKILIAPYGTNRITHDNIKNLIISQLPKLGVDIVAYQDEVGVKKSTPEQTKIYFSNLRQVHDSVPNVALWADVEIFEFSGAAYSSTYISPTSDFLRVTRQLESVLPVDVAVAYDLNGMFDSSASAVTFYNNYTNWSASIGATTKVANHGLIAHWKFDETSGAAALDSSGGGNTGVLINGPAWTAGKIDGALGFDGLDDHVVIGSGLIDSTGNSTFALWAKNSGDMTGSGSAVLSATGDGIFNMYPDMGESIKLSLGWKDWLFDDTHHAKVTIGAWAHYTVVIDNNTISTYLDGTLIWSSARTGAPSNPTKWTIGGRKSEINGYYYGDIDDLRIYNRALSLSEIQTLCCSGSSQRPSAPQGLTAK